MNKYSKKIIPFLLIMALFLTASAGVAAKKTNKATKQQAPVSTWTIPEYGEKAYNTMKAAMDAYDPLAETAPGLDATAAILIDAKSGLVLFDLDADGLRYPASMTKLVTVLVTLDAVDQGKVAYTDTVTFSEAATALEGSKTGYLPGTTDTLEHCLEMIMVFSANDAAYAVAEHIAGSVEAFAELMNAKAAELGMANSHFVNPNGLHDDSHWTTARDMATLSRYCVNQPEVMRLASMKSTAMPDGRTVYNTNKLLFWCEGTDGLKTGTTTAAGHCLTATAERNGMRLIAVTMGSQKDYTHYIDAMKLLEYGFANFNIVTAVEKGTSMGDVPVLYGKEDKVPTATADSIAYVLHNGETAEPEILVEMNEAVEGPAKAGMKAGEVIVKVNGNEVGRCDLITTEDISKRGILMWLKDFFSALIAGI